MNSMKKAGGIALIIGAFLNLTRVLPIYLTEGINMDNFSPKNLEQTIFAAQLGSYYISHIMALIAAPLLIYGFYALYEELKTHNQKSTALAGLIGLSLGLVLYTVGVVVDGLLLPGIVEHSLSASGAEQTAIRANISFGHAMAVSFGGIGFATMLLTIGFFGLGVLRGFERKILGVLGVAVSALSALGFLTGLFDLHFTKNFMVLGGLTSFMFLLLLMMGVVMLWDKN